MGAAIQKPLKGHTYTFPSRSSKGGLIVQKFIFVLCNSPAFSFLCIPVNCGLHAYWRRDLTSVLFLPPQLVFITRSGLYTPLFMHTGTRRTPRRPSRFLATWETTCSSNLVYYLWQGEFTILTYSCHQSSGIPKCWIILASHFTVQNIIILSAKPSLIHMEYDTNFGCSDLQDR